MGDGWRGHATSLGRFRAAVWVVLGFGSLIREEYYEHRIWCVILAIWALGCLFGAGVMEIVFVKPAFPWLPRLWDFDLAQETFEAGLPQANAWRTEGWGKLVIGIAVAVVLLIVSLN